MPTTKFIMNRNVLMAIKVFIFMMEGGTPNVSVQAGMQMKNTAIPNSGQIKSDVYCHRFDRKKHTMMMIRRLLRSIK